MAQSLRKPLSSCCCHLVRPWIPAYVKKYLQMSLNCNYNYVLFSRTAFRGGGHPEKNVSSSPKKCIFIPFFHYLLLLAYPLRNIRYLAPCPWNRRSEINTDRIIVVVRLINYAVRRLSGQVLCKQLSPPCRLHKRKKVPI